MRGILACLLILCLASPIAPALARDGSKTVRDMRGKDSSTYDQATEGLNKKQTAAHWDASYDYALGEYDKLSQATPGTEEYDSLSTSYRDAKMSYDYGVDEDIYDGSLSKKYDVKELPGWDW